VPTQAEVVAQAFVGAVFVREFVDVLSLIFAIVVNFVPFIDAATALLCARAVTRRYGYLSAGWVDDLHLDRHACLLPRLQCASEIVLLKGAGTALPVSGFRPRHDTYLRFISCLFKLRPASQIDS
jgi:hypothetical protein